MSSRSKSPISRQGRGLKGLIACQQGGFSPFLFGMIIGVTVFSAVSLEYAKQQMVALQQQQAERAKARAQDIADALDFAILSETKETYTDTYSLDRARQFAQSSGKTRGDQDFLLTTRQGAQESYGNRGEKVAITASDDQLLRAQVRGSQNAAELVDLSAREDAPIAVYDTSEARDRQIRTSVRNMEQMAEQVYAFYAGNLRFPSLSEYETLQKRVPIRDAWGGDFEYDATPDQQGGQLSFTTPWNYRRVLNLSLKDPSEPAQNGSNEAEQPDEPAPTP